MQNRIKIIFPKAFFILVLATMFVGGLAAQSIIRPDNKQDYALQANTEFNKGNWEAGKKIVDEGLKKHPKDSDLRTLLGKYYFHHGQLDKSRYELIKALEQNPNNADAKEILVNVETRSKRYSSAICYVNELLEANPYGRRLWRKKIELYRLQGNSIEANRLLTRIKQIYPEDSVLWRDYIYETEMSAINLQKTGKIDEAITLRSELVNQEPNNPDHYIGLANDYIKAGDSYKALASIERGLTYAPHNIELINKKTSLLDEQKRYGELLSFLQQQMQTNDSPVLRQQYNYYLLEAARNTKEENPATLYGKILERNPGNDEAFNYVFNDLFGNQQYEEALYILNRYKRARGESKTFILRELTLYKKMGNTERVSTLTKQLFTQHPNDTHLRDEFVKIMYEEAKIKMNEERYAAAIDDLQQVVKHGDADMVRMAQNSIYSAAMALNDYNTASNVLNNIAADKPEVPELYLKRAEIHHKQKRYQNALSAYEQALSLTTGDEKLRLLGGYAEMINSVIKESNELFRYDESLQYVNRWLDQDPNNKEALRYAVNLSHQTNKMADMYAFAKRGKEAYPNDVFFKMKLAEYDGLKSENLAQVFEGLHRELLLSPYHEGLINTFSQTSENYANHLIKNKKNELSIEILDTALVYAPNNKSLKYMKGIAYEKLHQYDSAYYYQSFYEPAPLELSEFKQHLNYLNYRQHKNEIGLYNLHARRGDDYAINSISTVEYSRLEGVNTYIGRIIYAGRQTGKGYQLQGEWARVWNEKTHTRMNLAGANKFFSKVAFNASVYREIGLLKDLEIEVGLGYRWLSGGEHLSNLVLGGTKELEPWLLNLRFNNYIMNYKQNTLNKARWLFNLSGQARYYMSSPKNYLIGMASAGTAPDVDLINYQLYDDFSGLNTMVGAGVGHLISKTVSAGFVGTWYNYHLNADNYRNLYTLHFNLNVVF